MSRLTQALVLPTVLAAMGCDDLQGLEGTPTPLATIQLEAAGAPPGDVRDLRVALVWGRQWLPDPFCVLPAESAEAQAVADAGCRDILGFVPFRVGANLAVTPGVPARMELFDLPAADLMVGDPTGRVVYGSLVVYDDRNGDGTLNLRRARGDIENVPGEEWEPEPMGDADIVHGGSFVSMTQPDVRVAFLEGTFDVSAAYYPRAGCPAPPRGFSILSAGGFSEEEAIAATIRGELPQQDPATCGAAALDETTVVIPFVAPETVRDLACRSRGGGGIPDYEGPDDEFVGLEGLTWACVGLPDLDGSGGGDGITQLVVASPVEEPCRTVHHYLLRGCEEDPLCEAPEWDQTATPPDWWPCPVE